MRASSARSASSLRPVWTRPRSRRPGRYRSAVDVADLAEMLERHRAAAGVVGAAVGIASADQTIVAAAGHASIEPSVQVQPGTRFHVVSVTKVMVATVVTRLVAAGAWSIDDPLARHVPEVRSSWSTDVTLRHLLANTGGIPEREAWDQEFDADDDDCLAKLAAEIGSADALRRPDALWAYTNLGWCLLGRAIEIVTGLTFEDAMRRHLFEPLEMGETLFHHEGPIDPASLAFESSGGDPQVEEPWIRRALGPAGGTVWSTVDDLLTLARVHLRDGVVGSGVPFTPPGMLAGMRASHAEPRIPDWLDGWGLGLGRWDWPRATAFGWDGVGVGFRSFLRFIPQLSIGDHPPDQHIDRAEAVSVVPPRAPSAAGRPGVAARPV